MALLLALLMPVWMLGVVLALGRYEDFILTPPRGPHGSTARRLGSARTFTSEEGGEDA
ncbi:hypothetical protein AB0C51_09215 [Streptomyces pathocidini]|uniref:Uncharacterized protein n=1 Tax=Streptomyces pathocidini TaxID=1650571 RepID=A0ABW7UJW9_9ACTN|nr:hypothetical protein [Streptomyces pathocidini]